MNIQHKIQQKIGKWILLPVFVMGFVFTSCEDDIINLQPFNQISETVAFSTPEKVELSVIGMYQAAQVGSYETTPGVFGLRGYPFGASFVQQGDNRGEDVVNTAAFYGITYQNTYTSATANNRFHWVDTYRLLNRVNIIIEGVQVAADNGVISQELANSYKGEALLLRGAAYHELLVHFARPYKHTADASHMGVPYHKTPFTTQEAIDIGFETGRHSVAQCYAWILEDLDQAEEFLPTRAHWASSSSPNWRVSRGTKGAAAAYKARIHQHMWNMTGVVNEASKFVGSGPYASVYALGANPWDAFANNYTSNEYIYGMESSETNYPSVNGALASMYKRRLLVSHSPILWRNSFWLADDKRRDDGEMVFLDGGTVFTNKYRDDVGYTDISPMMRLPEVYLNLAEAYARNEDVANALIHLNAVRNRSLADPATQAYVAGDFASNVEILNAILHERRIELAMEGRRWSDIHRLQACPHFPIAGIPQKYANGTPPAAAFDLSLGPFTGPYGVAAVPYSDYRFLFPIPQVEVDANPTLAAQQNPGY